MLQEKMRSKILIIFLVIAFVVFGFSGIGAAKSKVRTVRVHSQMPVGNYITKAVDLFIKEATERSEGTLKFIHYPAQQLYKDTTIVEAVPEGLIEIGAAMNISPWAGKAPEVNLVALTCVWDDYDHYVRYCYDKENGGGFEYMLYDVAKEKLNVVNLGGYPYARNQVPLFKDPVKSAADWKGKKVRAGTKGQSIFSEAMGAPSVFMSSSETYMAMQRGILDGAQSGLSTHVGRKWYEVAKNLNYIDGLFPYEFHTFINLDFWNSLTKKQKRAMADAWLVAAKFDEKEAYEKELKCREILLENGVNIWDVPKETADAWKKKGVPMIKEKLILPAVGNDQKRADEIMQMIDNTRGLPPSTDLPAKLEVPYKMFETWHQWFLEKENLL